MMLTCSAAPDRARPRLPELLEVVVNAHPAAATRRDHRYKAAAARLLRSATSSNTAR